MSMDFEDCPNKPRCLADAQYWIVHCRCGEFLGFPNYRAATKERDELVRRYEAARDDCERRGLAPVLAKFDALVERSRPVIVMSFLACDDILRAGKYRNYDFRVVTRERDPASEENHTERAMVGEKLFPTCHQHIHYASLSPDGRGLLTYGDGKVAVCWDVTPDYLERRISLLDENSYFLYDCYALGERGATIPAGHRATWRDRSKLAAAKVSSSLTSAVDEDGLMQLLQKAGATREDDSYMEIAIYAESGLDTENVTKVTVQTGPITDEEKYRMKLLRASCIQRGITLIE